MTDTSIINNSKWKFCEFLFNDFWHELFCERKQNNWSYEVWKHLLVLRSNNDMAMNGWLMPDNVNNLIDKRHIVII